MNFPLEELPAAADRARRVARDDEPRRADQVDVAVVVGRGALLRIEGEADARAGPGMTRNADMSGFCVTSRSCAVAPPLSVAAPMITARPPNFPFSFFMTGLLFSAGVALGSRSALYPL